MHQATDQVSDNDYEQGAEFARRASSALEEMAVLAASRSNGSEAATETVRAMDLCAAGWATAADVVARVDPDTLSLDGDESALRREFEDALDECNDALDVSGTLLDDAERREG